MNPPQSATVGALVIGQTPRDDLTRPLLDALRTEIPNVTLVERGALDELDERDLPHDAPRPRPLETRLRNGVRIVLDTSYYAERLQSAQRSAEEAGALFTVLLCAGTFPDLHGSVRVIKPVEEARDALEQSAAHRLAVLCPFPEQQDACLAKWLPSHPQATLYVPPDVEERHLPEWIARHVPAAQHDALVLDYVGYAPGTVAAVAAALPLPVLDLGRLAAERALELVRHAETRTPRVLEERL